MENIVIVHAISTGYNLVEDTLQRGYYPVVLNLRSPGEGDSEMRESIRPRIEKKCRFIEERETYSETLEAVRELKPKVVLAGAEGGVELATRLAEDLGLPGNPTSILPQMKEKAAMHEALRKHGLRYIRGKLVGSPEEAASFYDELGVQRVVVKENSGASSVGFHICNSRQEVIDAVKTEFSNEIDYYGRRLDKMLIQEMIDGTEYVVNTVSCEGKVRLTSVFRYYKTVTRSGGKIYRYVESINSLTMENYELVQYAYRTAEAIGIRYGAVHGEYMVDDNGPVLIEINCRPMGGSKPADYINLLNGQHESDSHLDSYLFPDRFASEIEKPYRTVQKLVELDLSSNIAKHLISSPILAIAPRLKSYFCANLKSAVSKWINKTEDLHTSCGTLYLAHPDPVVVMREANLICKLEDKYSEVLFQSKQVEKASEHGKIIHTEPDTIADLLGFGDKYTMFNSDINPDQPIVKQKDYYDNLIIDNTLDDQHWTFEDCLKATFDLVYSLKKNGKFVATSRVHEMDTEGIEITLAVMELAGLTIDNPIQGYPDIIFGTKETE